jgi:uncharacterized protein YndB with AHSA1/START domain
MNDLSISRKAEFTLTRLLDAPPELVWRAWTDPAELARWHHPRGVAIPSESISADVRQGGRYRYTLVVIATGEEYPTGGVYLEVDEPERLVFTWAKPSDPVEDAPVVTLDLRRRGAQTELTFHLRGLSGFAGDDNVYDGWSEALDMLVAYALDAGVTQGRRHVAS